MKFKHLSVFLLTPLLLSSCGHRPSDIIRIEKNGELYQMTEPVVGSNYDNYLRHTNSEEILSLLDNNEPFIFYVLAETCSSCLAFKPNLLRYVYETSALVYYLNASNNDDYLEYSKIWQQYQDIFIANLEVPYLLIFETNSTYAKGAVSKMTASTYSPFETMMNQLVRVSNMYSLATYQSVMHHLNEDDDVLYFLYDRNNERARNIYVNKIFPKARDSEKSIKIVDLYRFSEEDGISLRETFELGETIAPAAYYYVDGQFEEAHLFGLDDVSDQQFLDSYL